MGRRVEVKALQPAPIDIEEPRVAAAVRPGAPRHPAFLTMNVKTLLFDLDDTLLGNDMDIFLPRYDLLGEYGRPSSATLKPAMSCRAARRR